MKVTFKTILISLLLQITGVKKLWQFKLLMKNFYGSSERNVLHSYFGTTYKVHWYDEWTLLIVSAEKLPIIWYIKNWNDLPSDEKERREKNINDWHETYQSQTNS